MRLWKGVRSIFVLAGAWQIDSRQTRTSDVKVFLSACLLLLLLLSTAIAAEPIPDKLVVLTFDDSSKSHFTVARALLKKYKFGATFFVTEGFDSKTNKRDYMTWEEIAELQESRIPDDCWRALELGNELKTGPVWSRAPFGSAAGRELLMARLLDEKASDASRLMALRQLREGGNYWSADPKRNPGTSIVSGEEQQAIIDRVVPLLKDEDDVWRRGAVDCLKVVSCPYAADQLDMLSNRAVPHFETLRREDPNPGVPRKRYAELKSCLKYPGGSF
jgi:peptidoglycan/xylan/chitin deacetylase (PgdA/CDA1 family)